MTEYRVKLPQTTRALDLLSADVSVIAEDWQRLDIELAEVAYGRIVNRRSIYPQSPNPAFLLATGGKRLRPRQVAAITPRGPAGKLPDIMRAKMASRPQAEACEVCEAPRKPF